MTLLEKLQLFHGALYSEDSGWNKDHKQCLLCKTQNKKERRTRHWANGLCRSCYRRLSVNHRLYNDSWVKDNLKTTSTRKQSSTKKAYKSLKDRISFAVEDIASLLERYAFRCAYCKAALQLYDYKKSNAFQIEYLLDTEGQDATPHLVPICRTCNCSKKNITSEDKLKRWAAEHNISYPIKFIKPL
jgi:hypothetical protein